MVIKERTVAHNKRSEYLAKNTAVFAIGSIATKLISFFLVPLYTNILTTEEYGVIDLITTISMVLAPILILNISEAVMRFALDKDADYEKLMSIGLSFLGLAIILGLLIIPTAHLFDKINNYATLIYFYIISLAASQLLLCYLRGKEKLILYSVGSIIQTFSIAVLNILFLAVLKYGIVGYFYAYILANSITILFAFITGNVTRVFKCFCFDGVVAKEMITYSIVLIPNTFMWWIMNSSDRIMVTAMVSVAANGIYAVSYKIPTLVTTIATVFNQAWSYSAIRENGADDEHEYNNQVLNGLISIVMMLSIALLTIIKPFLSIYVGSAYYEAWKYTPFLIVGCSYLTIASFMAASYTVHKDSMGYLLSSTVGAAMNIGLNFMLIPKYGVYGAAIATCMSYMVVFVFRLIHTRKYIHYNVKTKEFILGSILLVGSSFLLFVDNPIGIALQIFICFLAIYLYSSTWIPLSLSLINKIKKIKDKS